MRIAITGANGFIGRAVARELMSEGHDVLCMDLQQREARDATFLQGTITSMEHCQEAFADAEVVIHSAAIHHANAVASDPLRIIDVNVMGTLNVLRAAVMSGTRRVVFLSSAKVYGPLAEEPSRESDEPRPLETYALTKVTGEHYCKIIGEREGIETVIVRPFSVYGPGQDVSTGYVGMVLDSLKENGRVHLPGAPEFSRDFVHIDDVTKVCTLAAQAPLPPYTILNAGHGQAVTLAELLEIASEASGIAIEAEFEPPKLATIENTHANMMHAVDLLGFEPRIPLQTGLEDTLQWLAQSEAQKALRTLT